MPDLNAYRVDDPKFSLRSIEPGDTPCFEGDADAQRAQLDSLAQELDELQNLLHAENKRKLLLVLQGIDTSGKDGTIRWVFSRT
ncbi:MAG: polyphosphate kinase 2 family protein, partial [Comamonadaceae bacterium]